MIWHDIKGYEGVYQVSDSGAVRSLDRIITSSNGRKLHYKGHILAQSKNSKGYRQVQLNSHGKFQSFRIHRLVAEAFIPNPKNLPQVNHKDEDKGNNHVNNLEWCDNLYNCRYGTKSKRQAEKMRGKVMPFRGLPREDLWKAVVSTDENGNERTYASLDIAVKETGAKKGNIVKACRGIRKHAGGLKWRYANAIHETDGH